MSFIDVWAWRPPVPFVRKSAKALANLVSPGWVLVHLPLGLVLKFVKSCGASEWNVSFDNFW